MKKMTSYFVFFLISVSLWGQSGLPIPRSFSTPVADPLPGYRPTSTLRTVQPRNFVELQLDSVLYTWFFDNTPYVAQRRLFTYSGDMVIENRYSISSSGVQNDMGYQKTAFNNLNLPVYYEWGDDNSAFPSVGFLYYNPGYPTVLDSVRYYWIHSDGLSFDGEFYDYTLFQGSSLIGTEQIQFIENNEVVSVQSTVYEYDSEQREILALTELLNLGSGNTFVTRTSTEYLADSAVAIVDFRLPGDMLWNLQNKTDTIYAPGSHLPLKILKYNWNAAAQDWRPARFDYYTYDTDNREILMEMDLFAAGVPNGLNGTKTTYLQEYYVDRKTFYKTYLNGLSDTSAIHQYYYSMPSSTTQPHTETAQVELAPNPAHAYLRARTEQNIQLAELYDLQGRLVMSIATDGTNVLHVHRNNLPSGIYTLRLRLENGATVSERVQWE